MHLFYRLPRNIIKSFSGYNWAWHLLAIAFTYSIVVSDFDWHYYLATRNPLLQRLVFPAVVGGMFLPILVPLTILIIGLIRKSQKLIVTAWAMGQAALLGLVISSAYKFFTGRIPPEYHGTLTTDISRQFQFGFYRGGVFWGWPSSHTTSAFAVAFALIILFPKNKLIRVLALIYAVYVGLGISISIHWFSEFVAGAIIGTVIGIAVGKTFKEKLPA